MSKNLTLMDLIAGFTPRQKALIFILVLFSILTIIVAPYQTVDTRVSFSVPDQTGQILTPATPVPSQAATPYQVIRSDGTFGPPDFSGPVLYPGSPPQFLGWDFIGSIPSYDEIDPFILAFEWVCGVIVWGAAYLLFAHERKQSNKLS